MATGILALGLVLIVEGLVWVLTPSLVERMLEALRDMPEQARRLVGLLCVISGLILLWGAQHLGF